MKERSIYEYYAFGFNYHMWRFDWEEKDVSGGKDDIDAYLRKIEELELPVTSNIVEPLRGHREGLDTLPNGKIPKEIAKEIESLIEKADATLDAELKLKKVLFVTPKRFDVSVLLEKPEYLLSSDTWQGLCEISAHDFKEAAKCIAFMAPTAAAFHLMRCVEATIKQLYFVYVRQNRMERPMWGPMVQKLREKRNPKPNRELLDHLDMIRTNFRNPTQHPRKIYDIEEAQDLMHSSIVALNYIVKSIGKRGR